MTPKTKEEWRQFLKEKRASISQKRREEASFLLFEKLKTKGTVLSFTSINTEIDLSPLNRFLKEKRRLILVPTKIDPQFKIPFSQIDCILVPGLGFDRERYRIGYGLGYYDRILAQAGSIPTIGVGFKEQYSEELFPRDAWDLPVKELLLV